MPKSKDIDFIEEVSIFELNENGHLEKFFSRKIQLLTKIILWIRDC